MKQNQYGTMVPENPAEVMAREFEQAVTDHERRLKNIAAAAPALKVAFKAEKRWAKLKSSKITVTAATWIYGARATIKVECDSFRDVLPLLEWVELKSGEEFISTWDYAAGGQREYNTKSIQVKADLRDPDSNEKCKRVITGYTHSRPEPIYAIQCD